MRRAPAREPGPRARPLRMRPMGNEPHKARPARCDARDPDDAWRRVCPHCSGIGLIDTSVCPNCGGSGRVADRDQPLSDSRGR
jgi:hypothetical protein